MSLLRPSTDPYGEVSVKPRSLHHDDRHASLPARSTGHDRLGGLIHHDEPSAA
jgi:hypothetical protein